MCVLLVLLDPALVVLNPTAENQFANLDQTSRASPEPHCAPADQKQRLIGFVSQSALIPLRGHGFQQARCPSMAYYLNRVLSFAHLARTALRASGAERFLRRCGRFAPAVLSCAWRLLCLTSFGQRSAHSVTVKPVTVAAVRCRRAVLLHGFHILMSLAVESGLWRAFCLVLSQNGFQR